MRRLKRWQHKLYLWFKGLDHTSYMMLSIFRINEGYIRKGMDPFFIETKVVKALGPYYKKEIILEVYRKAYSLCKQGCTEEEFVKVLREIQRK